MMVLNGHTPLSTDAGLLKNDSLSVTCDRSVVFSMYVSVSSTYKTDRHDDITEILMKVVLGTINLEV
jgi:hypothetical protein